jgi:uroporphyrinogen decarboxylase
VDFLMRPQFEEKVLERKERSQIVQDWKGNICEISNDFDVTYLRQAIDFVTRRWIKCPVETRADWVEMKRRYDADDAGRFPADFAERATRLRDRAYPYSLTISGPFWQMREWLGAEGLCMLLLDEPDWAEEMIAFYEGFVLKLLSSLFDRCVPDHLCINEDMAYKERPFISPEMARRFLLPCWRRWVKLCRSAGVKILDVDSDGRVDALIPLWLEAGFNCTSPVEVVAGNDLPEYRRRFGRKLAYHGGVDKQKIAAGGEAIRAELERLRPVIRSGGYIPGCDHGVPADVSWDNWVHYCRLLAVETGWL